MIIHSQVSDKCVFSHGMVGSTQYVVVIDQLPGFRIIIQYGRSQHGLGTMPCYFYYYCIIVTCYIARLLHHPIPIQSIHGEAMKQLTKLPFSQKHTSRIFLHIHTYIRTNINIQERCTGSHLQYYSMQSSALRLDKLKAHEKLHVVVLVPFAVEERHRSDPRPQLRHWQHRLPAKVVFLRHVILVHLNPQQSNLWDGQGEAELFLPYWHPVILDRLCLLHHRVCWDSSYANLPYQWIRTSYAACNYTVAKLNLSCICIHTRV